MTATTGAVELDVPNDRAATFEPQTVKKRRARGTKLWWVMVAETLGDLNNAWTFRLAPPVRASPSDPGSPSIVPPAARSVEVNFRSISLPEACSTVARATSCRDGSPVEADTPVVASCFSGAECGSTVRALRGLPEEIDDGRTADVPCGNSRSRGRPDL
ncbi:hypothetical protein H7I01_28045 [Mycobacterium palustre]|nr:hypothetical protein [Mycobacterium palustre]